jgi:hypothetical protein
MPCPPASEPAAADDLAGAPTLEHIGRYALKRKLGEGGLGTVYEAWDPLLSRTVAVKTLQFDLSAPQRLALDRLFLNEARAVAGLNHPHIVTVHDAGLSAHGVYIAMERLRGRDLRQAIAGGWRPTPTQAAQLVRRVADALAYAHARGVVHCDIKPANIFLTRKSGRRCWTSASHASRTTHRTRRHLRDVRAVAAGRHDRRLAALPGARAAAGRQHRRPHRRLFARRRALRTAGRAQGLRGRIAGPDHERGAAPEPGIGRQPAARRARRAGRRGGQGDGAPPEDRHAGAAELALALRPWQERPAAELPRQARRRNLALLLLLLGGAMLLGGTGSWMLREQVEGRAWSSSRPRPVDPVPPAPVADSLPLPAEPSDLPRHRWPTPAPAAAPPPPAAPKVRPPRARRKAEPTAAPAPVAAPPPGRVRLAVSPWGEIEVDGRVAGITPPLTLDLPAGAHQHHHPQRRLPAVHHTDRGQRRPAGDPQASFRIMTSPRHRFASAAPALGAAARSGPAGRLRRPAAVPAPPRRPAGGPGRADGAARPNVRSSTASGSTTTASTRPPRARCGAPWRPAWPARATAPARTS